MRPEVRRGDEEAYADRPADEAFVGGKMQISSAIAQLRTTDLAESIRFYTTKVGLTLEFQYEDFYAGIRAGSQLFHLKLSDEKDPSIEFVDKGEHFHLYLETDDAVTFNTDNMRLIALAALLCALTGCATPYRQVPLGYAGPIATLSDGGTSESRFKARIFVASEIDGKAIENSIGAALGFRRPAVCLAERSAALTERRRWNVAKRGRPSGIARACAGTRNEL